jgi:hypothetical protein
MPRYARTATATAVSPGPNPPVAAQLASLGGYFAIDVHPSGTQAPQPWRPMRELIDAPAQLRARVDTVRIALAATTGRTPQQVEARVAASVTQLGLTARLLSAALGVTALTGSVLDLNLDQLWWQPVLGGPFPLSLPLDSLPPRARKNDPSELANRIATRIVNGPMAQLVEATAAMSVARRVLWGNVASAVYGASSMIGQARPDLRAQALAVAAALFGLPPLTGTAAVDADGRFRRRSCCLLYRIAHREPSSRSVCGDCVLDEGLVRTHQRGPHTSRPED